MKLNKETERAYLTKADMEEIQSKLTVLSDTELTALHSLKTGRFTDTQHHLA